MTSEAATIQVVPGHDTVDIRVGSQSVTVVGTATVGPQGVPATVGGGALLAANNLSDVANAVIARTNLGLGTASTHAATDFDAAGVATAAVSTEATARAAADTTNANAISAEATTRATADTTNATAIATETTRATAAESAAQAAAIAASQPASARLTTLAGTTDTGTGAVVRSSSPALTTPTGIVKGDVGLGNVLNSVQLVAASNLSDVASAGTARTNLGLGSAATHPSTDFDAAGAAAAVTPTTLGLVVGTNVEAHDADLTAIAALDASTSGAIASDGSGWIKKTYAQLKTALGLVKADVGLGNVDNTADASKTFGAAAITSGVFNIARLATGTPNGSKFVRDDGVLAAPAGAGDMLAANNLSDLANAGTARTNLGLGTAATQASSAFDTAGAAAAVTPTTLGLVIGTNVEAHDTDLTTIAAISPANDDIIQRKAGAWTNRTVAQYKTDLALNNVDNTSDATKQTANDARYQPLDSDLTTIAALTATTDNMVQAVGSAWASRTPAQVRTALSLVIGTNVQAWDADLDALASGGGWLADTNAWTAHVPPTQASMTTIVAGSTVGHASLTYANGDAVVPTGFANTTGVFNGAVYYIVGQTSTTVQLALTPGGTAVTFGGTADTTAVTLTGWSQFTVPVDASVYLAPGTKFSYNDGAVDYGVVATAVNNSGTTTVTPIYNSDYSVANATLTAPRYSYAASPQGFPAAFNWTPTLIGWSSNPTFTLNRWSVDGRRITIFISHLGNGTSSLVGHTATAPVTSATITNMVWGNTCTAVDNGTTQTGDLTVAATAVFITLHGIITTNTNTASGNSRIARAQLTYEF